MHDHDDLQQRLGALGSRPINPAQQSADLTAMATVQAGSRFSPKLRLAGAFLAGLLIGGTGLAAADALPDSAQHVAHATLAKVGVDVPNPARYHGSECGPEQKNHGGYVSQASGPDKKTMAESDCGKPLKAADASDDGVPEDKPSKAEDLCHGKPAWATDKTMSPEARTAAKEGRMAECGDDDHADEGDKADHADAPEVDGQEVNGADHRKAKPDTAEDHGDEGGGDEVESDLTDQQ